MALTLAIRTRAEDFRDQFALKAVNRQNAFFANHGRFWQGLALTAGPPDGTLDTVPNLDVRPSYQVETWIDFLGTDLFFTTVPCQLRVDAYEGPQGFGWTATARVISQGEVWTRTWEVGPEDWRAETWHREETFNG